MSARMPSLVAERDVDSLDVHDWLERINDGGDVLQLGSSPLATVCASAVDPLEIAVALEVAGISHAVATDRYNRADVFALARTLWSRIPMHAVPAKAVTMPRSGDRRDLGRGVLYVLPALMLLALTTTFEVRLPGWVLPWAITWGWGLGQVAAFTGYRLQGADITDEASIMVRVVIGAAVSTSVLSVIATIVFGGGAIAVVAAAALVTYMVASAIMLVRAEERWLALLLVPGSLASIYLLATRNTDAFSRTLALAAIGGSFVAVLLRSGHQARLHIGEGRRRFERGDVYTGAAHLLHGVICGVAVSVVVIQFGHASPASSLGRALLPAPLLASLGVMEWQLHSFRSRMARLTRSLTDIGEFPARARQVFYRSFTICTAAIVVPAIVVVVAIRIHGGHVPLAALAVECALGAAFFVDLIIVLLDRLDLALRSWLLGIAIGSLALLASFALINDDLSTLALPCVAAAVAVVLFGLLLHIRSVVSTVLNH